MHTENGICVAHWDKELRLSEATDDWQGVPDASGWMSRSLVSPRISVTHTTQEDIVDKPMHLGEERTQAPKGGLTPEVNKVT